MKKYFLILIAILCMILVLTSCGKAPSQADPDAIAVIDAGREKISVYTELYKKETGEFIIPFHKRLDEVKDRIPVVTWQEGMVMEFSDGYECWGISAYDLSGELIGSHLGKGDLSELSALNSGDYYFDAYVVEEHEDEATDYKGYNCVFRMTLPDLDPLVTVVSGGEETVAPKYWYCSMGWVEDEDGSGGWMFADGMGIHEDMEANFAKLPEVRMAEDFSIRFGENVTPKSYIDVCDMSFADVGWTKDPEYLKTLESGSYYVVMSVFRNDTEVHEGETGYDGYHCGFKLIVPGDNTPIEISDEPEGPLVTAVTERGEVPLYEYKDGVDSEDYNPWVIMEDLVQNRENDLPEVSFAELTDLKVSDDVFITDVIVFDTTIQNSRYHWFGNEEKFFELAPVDLRKGKTYILWVLVKKNGFRIIDGEQEYSLYECACRLTVPR